MRGRSPRPVVLLVLGTLAVTAVVVAIGSSTGSALQSDVARRLAERSDAVAASLARGDRCTANRYAEQLRTGAIEAVRRNLVSPELAPELLTRTARLSRAVTCPPPIAPAPTPASHSNPFAHSGAGSPAIGKDGHTKGDHGRGRGEKRGHGNGKGDSE